MSIHKISQTDVNALENMGQMNNNKSEKKHSTEWLSFSVSPRVCLSLSLCLVSFRCHFRGHFESKWNKSSTAHNAWTKKEN